MLNPEIFNATIQAHGLYNSEQFVLRLSPKNHALMDRVTAGDFDPENTESDMLQAFSTYLHETIHWWQHTGSTSGFVLSMCYPLQLHSNLPHMRRWCELGAPTKPIMTAAVEGQQNGVTHDDERQACANVILNNTADYENYRKWLLVPQRAEEIRRDPHFHSEGHCFRIIYSDLVYNFASEVDPNYNLLPNPATWVSEFDRLTAEEVMGYYRGTPSYKRLVGVRDIFEGQACFSQIQYLTCSGIGPGEIQYFRDQNMLHGVYEHAFSKFFELTEIEPPHMVIDPRMGLFLLVCDIAINPMEGLLCDIPDFARFVNVADPCIRFLTLCEVVRVYKGELVDFIQDYSAEEYTAAARMLSAAAKFVPPEKGWETLSQLIQAGPPVSELMEEYDKIKYNEANVVMRVMASHFMAFNMDKSDKPHFFCWPGIWVARMGEQEWISKLWLKHLALFRDSEHDDGIFVSQKAGTTEKDATSTLNGFFANIIVCDLARQWVLRNGAFNFDFRWLSERHTPERWKEMSERGFEELFGVKIDDVIF